MKKRIVILGAFLSAFLTVRAAGAKICFEAETAELIEAPMVLVTNGIEGASGAYLEIPEGAGNPPKVTDGKAVFAFEVPSDGIFTLWCRVWWEGECSNSFTVQSDDGAAFLFGEDATYKVWHWVKYPVARTTAPLRLSKGRHTLTFRNREDGVRLDQILLSADRRFVPVDIEVPGLRK
ncbi:MAG: hypothetical protein PHG96_00680 [Kiritimatiellae bacterium]|nr:hypothetical protein [Kiritimatiellia bacterium]MDD4024706.1 hypothetical protein [Kiritimatiellia bacterium]MDD4621709.1 hypothetical protein [Kiritimatiellia bacterium]